ncbi:hypothetical protein AAMO2058_000151500 [Amorphochlora amoebiformis]
MFLNFHLLRDVLIATVGLPARGKSWLSARVVTYINWLGGKAKVFNAGKYRRKILDARESGRSEFFGSKNAKKRDEIAKTVLNEGIKWLHHHVAVFDATNTTPRRRKIIKEAVAKCSIDLNLIFLESICTKKEILRENLLMKVRNSPDFKNIPEKEALSDLKKRIAKYEKVYKEVDDSENTSYIKLQDMTKVTCKGIHGSIALQIANLLMSCHSGHRPIVLLRAAEAKTESIEDLRAEAFKTLRGFEDDDEASTLGSLGPYAEVNSTGSLGPYAEDDDNGSTSNSNARQSASLPKRRGSLSLLPRNSFRMPVTSATSFAKVTSSGKIFISKLKEIAESADWGKSPAVFSSTLPRAIETSQAFDSVKSWSQQWSALNVLDTGLCHGMSVEEIKKKLPDDYKMWKKNPFRYRFPGGESYMDLCHRLSPLVLELERIRRPVVVALYAYFKAIPIDLAPTVKLEQHTVIILTPNQYGWKERKRNLDNYDIKEQKWKPHCT